MPLLRLSLAAAAVFALAGSTRASVISSDPNLPQLFPDAAYVFEPNQPVFVLPFATAVLHVADGAVGPVTLTPSGADEIASYGSLWAGSVTVNDTLDSPLGASGTEEVITFGKLGVTTGTFSAEILSMSLSGTTTLANFQIRESPTLASLGQTTITPLGGGLYQIDSFFEVFTELSLDGGQSWLPSESSSRMTLEAVPEPSPASLFGAALLALAGYAALRSCTAYCS